MKKATLILITVTAITVASAAWTGVAVKYMEREGEQESHDSVSQKSALVEDEKSAYHEDLVGDEFDRMAAKAARDIKKLEERKMSEVPKKIAEFKKEKAIEMEERLEKLIKLKKESIEGKIKECYEKMKEVLSPEVLREHKGSYSNGAYSEKREKGERGYKIDELMEACIYEMGG